MHDAHLAQGELVPILLRDVDHDHVLDESNLRLSKLRVTVYCAAKHLDRSCVRLCDNELHPLCAALLFEELLGDRHHGTIGQYLDGHDPLEDGHYLDDRDLLNHHDHTTDDHHDLLTDDLDLLVDGHDLLEDDLLNHHGYKTNDHRDHRDHRDPLTDDHCLDDRDLLVDDLPNHHDHTTDDHRDHRDLLVGDRDLGHHFARMQDDLLDDYLDGLDVRHDPLTDGRDYLMDDRDCLKDGRDCPKDDPDLRLACLNDHQRHRGVRDAKVCQILLPVADDVDRDFQGLALNEVYLQTTPKRRRLTECD